jgi:hypothetical protein
MAIKINGATVIADNQAFTTTSTVSATGNITGGNLSVIGTITAAGINTGSSTISTTGNVVGGNVLSGAQIIATGLITGNGINSTSGNIGVPPGVTTLLLGNIYPTTVWIGGEASNVFIANVNSTTRISGNLTANAAISAVGNITGGNISATNLAGSLTTAAQANITSVGTLTSVSVTGNVQGGNILTAGQISATGNITGGNITINGSAVITGNLSVSGTETIFNVANLTVNDLDIIVANNVTGGANINGAGIQAGNPATATWFFNNATTSWQSNIGITPTANGTLSLGGASNYWGNAFLTTATVTGNVNGGNLRTAGLISAAGNITTAGQFTGAGTGLTGTAASLTVGTATVAGTVTTAAQPNITSVGTLTSLNSGAISSSGNVTGANLLTGGLISATGAITGAAITGTSLTVSTGNITGGNLLLSGAILDSAQLDIQTTASNANIALAPNGTGVVTVSTQLIATGNVTGGNIRTAGLISATGAITGAAITGTSLTVSTGNVTAGNIVNANANGVGNIGSSTTYFNTVFAKATSAQYADLAEKYTADAEYASGTVLVFGGSAEVTVDATDADPRVAGVVSTNPSYIMNAGCEGTNVATVALTGRVPCLVTGTVRKGDLMVAAGLGRARAEADPRVGTVIGKALEDHDGESGTIEVVVGRF